MVLPPDVTWPQPGGDSLTDDLTSRSDEKTQSGVARLSRCLLLAMWSHQITFIHGSFEELISHMLAEGDWIFKKHFYFSTLHALDPFMDHTLTYYA